MDRVNASQVGTCMGEPFCPKPCQRKSESACGGGEYQAFRYLLAQQSQTAAAEGGANRDLFATRRCARDEQAGYIEAGDEQDASGCREQNIKLRARFVNNSVKQRACVGAICGEWRGVAHVDAFGRGIDFTQCLCHVGAGSQPCNYEVIVRVNSRHLNGVFFVVDRGPYLYMRLGIGKRGRQHSDDGVRMGVELDRLAEDIAVAAVAALPQTVR